MECIDLVIVSGDHNHCKPWKDFERIDKGILQGTETYQQKLTHQLCLGNAETALSPYNRSAADQCDGPGSLMSIVCRSFTDEEITGYKWL